MNYTKEYLLQLADLKDRIEAARRRRQEIAAALPGYKGLLYTTDRVQTTPEDQLAAAISELIDRDKNLERDIAVLVCDVDLIRSQIRQLPAGRAGKDRKRYRRYARILWKHYEEEKSLRQVAEEMAKTHNWIRIQHGYALLAFEKNYFQEISDFRETLEKSGTAGGS